MHESVRATFDKSGGAEDLEYLIERTWDDVHELARRLDWGGSVFDRLTTDDIADLARRTSSDAVVVDYLSRRHEPAEPAEPVDTHDSLGSA